MTPLKLFISCFCLLGIFISNNKEGHSYQLTGIVKCDDLLCESATVIATNLATTNHYNDFSNKKGEFDLWVTAKEGDNFNFKVTRPKASEGSCVPIEFSFSIPDLWFWQYYTSSVTQLSIDQEINLNCKDLPATQAVFKN